MSTVEPAHSPFTAAGALVVLLRDIYYGALLFLFGAILIRAVTMVWTKEEQ